MVTERIARTGKGHVEQVDVFPALAGKLLMIGRAQMLSVAHGKTQAFALDHHGFIAHAGAQICPRHNDHRGFQTLEFVDGHDAHGIHVFGHGHLFFAALGAPVLQKCRQGGKALFFRAVQHFHKAA